MSDRHPPFTESPPPSPSLSGGDYARQSSPHLGPILAMIRSVRPSPDEMATHPEGVHISRPEGVSSSHPEGVPPLIIQDLSQIRIDPDRIVSQVSPHTPQPHPSHPE